MRRSASVLALSVAVVTGVAGLAGSAAAVASRPQPRIVRLTIRAIDRNGRPEQIVTGNFDGYGLRRVQGGLVSGANYLGVGRYAIAVEVPTLDSDGNDIANTLIAQNVNVQHNMTLTLSARHSVPVQVSLNGVQLDSVMGNVCANTGPDSFGVLQVLTDAVQAPPRCTSTRTGRRHSGSFTRRSPSRQAALSTTWRDRSPGCRPSRRPASHQQAWRRSACG